MTEEIKMNNEQEAQGALDSTETLVESEQMVPVAKHAALRQRAQAAELEAANLKGQLTTLQQTTTPSVKSPLEIEIEKQKGDGIDEEDMAITPALYRKQKAFESQQAKQVATIESTQVMQTAQLASTNQAKQVHNDWQEVIVAALPNMTKGEILDIESQIENFGEAAYNKAKEVLERLAPESSKSEAEAETKKAAEAVRKAAELATANKKVPTQDEILKDLNVDPATEAAARL